MKALRRSIKGEKEKATPHISIAPKSAVAIVPPKKVIRALYDYEAKSNQELSFSRGDFFHVIGRENDPDWYDACNPALPDARGIVPVSYFQALGRTERDSAQSDSSRSAAASTKTPDHDSGYSENPRHSKTGSKGGAMVYGIVMYDFTAERPDELDAKRGEAIIVIAQSNPEWYVAKPIGRLGGPGLIPVSFVEIRDMTSNTAVANPQEAVRRAGIPKVEEWKRMAADYKNSSITLGKFEVGGASGVEQGMERLSVQGGPVGGAAASTRASQANGYPQAGYASQRNTMQMQQQQQQQQQQQAYGATASQLFAPISASIPRYCFAEEKYWFVIEAVLEDGRVWELSRYYEDFYDFQIALLTEFPVEAGNTTNHKRTLPYMPGPVNYVTDAITEGRLHNLDAYVKNLLTQPEYISKCDLVCQFFSPRQGDRELVDEEDGQRMSASSQGNGSADGAALQNGNGYATATARAAGGNPAAMTRQPSSLSQPSQTSLSPGVNSASQVHAMKVKLSYNNELIAIRVPSDIQFGELCDKIRERLKVTSGQMQLFYKDDVTGEKPSLMSNNDIDTALQRNEKLMIYVEVV